MTRKFFSASTAGLVDFRSDKERIARSTRLTKRAVKAQNRMLRRQSAVASATDLQQPPAPVRPASAGPPPGWYPDQQAVGMQRWWDGYRWTEHTQGTPVAGYIPPAAH